MSFTHFGDRFNFYVQTVCDMHAVAFSLFFFCSLQRDIILYVCVRKYGVHRKPIETQTATDFILCDTQRHDLFDLNLFSQQLCLWKTDLRGLNFIQFIVV